MSREVEEQLRKEISLKEEQIDTIKEQIGVLKCRLLEEQTGFKIGDKVVDYVGQKGMLCFDRNYPCIWLWKKLKKDGTPSETVTCSYRGSFTKIED